MSIGYPITKAAVDAMMGAHVVNLRNAFDDVVLFKALLDDSSMLSDGVLQGLGYTGSVSSLEIQQIRNAYTSMSLLNTVSRGGSTVPSLVDFWFDAKHLANLNFR